LLSTFVILIVSPQSGGLSVFEQLAHIGWSQMRSAVLVHPMLVLCVSRLHKLTGNKERGTMGKAKVKILDFAKSKDRGGNKKRPLLEAVFY
jgi:hypothetical protein